MIAVFTPTRLWGGLDVTLGSLLQQTRRDFVWIVGDEHERHRRDVYLDIGGSGAFGGVVHFDTSDVREQHGGERTLCRAYNYAVEIALEYEAELFVTLQDYVKIPKDGLERYLRMADEYGPGCYTGICDIAGDPEPSEITDPEGKYTIFDVPYWDHPLTISWTDVRRSEIYGPNFVGPCEPLHWEANWAAVHGEVLGAGIRWDEEYDWGIAYENQDFALQALSRGFPTWIDTENRSVSLPHKKYFPEIEQREAPMTHINRERMKQKWGPQAA